MRKDETLEQRITRQSVRAMQSGATYFANCIQAWQTCRAVHVRLDSATLIMRRRHNRDRLLRHVDAEAHTRLVNIRKALTQKLHRFVRDIEKDALGAGALDLSADSSPHNIPPPHPP